VKKHEIDLLFSSATCEFRFVDALLQPKTYYRVSHLGSAFGPELNGSTFVYQMNNTVHLSEFLEILEKKAKEVLVSGEKVIWLSGSKDVSNIADLDPSECYMQVRAVLPDWSRDEQERRSSSPVLQNFGVNRFVECIPFTKTSGG